MPMPQRKPKQPQTFQSNNTCLFSGRVSNSIGNNSGSGNARPFYAPANSYPHPHPNYHHLSNFGGIGPIHSGLPPPPQLPPPPHPPGQQPPLITDTLTACLDVNGTYVCTSYSPRCYIIQKVTPTSVTVTPTQPIGLAIPNTSSATCTNNLGFHNCEFQRNSNCGSSFHRPTSKKPPPSAGGAGASNQHLPTTTTNSTTTNSQNLQQPKDSSSANNINANTKSNSQQGKHNNNVKDSSNSSTDSEKKATTNQKVDSESKNSLIDRSFMNGEVSCSVPLGENTLSQMGVAPQCSDSETLASDKRLLNGMSDGHGPEKSTEPMELNQDGAGKHSDLVTGRGQTLPINGDEAQAMNDDDHVQISSDTTAEELRHLLLAQLEYYFSHENLSNDKFLVSQMDSDQYVYISTVANFNMIKKLTNNLELITDVLKESKQVQVHSDGKRVRPVSNRTVVILRGIPKQTPIEEIKALFERENSPKCNNCEFAFNDSWYLAFDSDDEAIRAHKYLREDVREFKGQPIMARIKSRPITLLAQGVGVNPTVKNGYNAPPPPTITQYMSAPYVSTGSQPGPTNVAAAQIYPAGQQLTSTVFTIPANPYASYGAQIPWSNYYDLNASTIFSLNGMQQAPAPPAPYNKGMQMGTRHRNAKPETENYPYRSNYQQRRNVENSNNGGGGGNGGNKNSHQYAGGGGNHNHHRKNSGPTPLLAVAPLPPNSHHSSQSHNHSQPTVSSGNSVSSASRNSGHYNSVGLPSHNVPHPATDSYHPNSSRPYRNTDNHRQSPRGGGIGSRKPGRTYDDNANYENHNHHNSTSSASRGNPSSRVVVPSAVSPQPPVVQGNSPQHQSGKSNFEMEANAFPPLPGANTEGNRPARNGDSTTERLSDVVKGVKNMKTSSSIAGDKEEVGINTVQSEVVVSAEESRDSTYVVSAASPTKEMDLLQDSSQSSAIVNKKEFREVGVGSADDSHEIRVARSREPSTAGVKNKEMADKSTRTDVALLHGDHPNSGSKSEPKSGKFGTVDPYQQSDNYRKMNPQSSKQSPANRKGGFSQHGPASSGVVGSEVPYSHKESSSPAKSGATSGFDSSNSFGGDRSGGASYVAKTQADNNGRVGSSNSSTNPRNINTNDKEAFPAPAFIKSNVPSAKSASVADQSKEVTRSGDKKDGDLKKSDENNCSNDEVRDGPVRLSYAQVAQSRKEKVPPNSGTQHPQPSSSSSSVVSQSGSVNAQGISDEKKRPASESKDTRSMPKNTPRGNGGYDQDRNRGFRRYRNRISSEHSQDGGGNGNFGGRQPRRNRSPK